MVFILVEGLIRLIDSCLSAEFSKHITRGQVDFCVVSDMPCEPTVFHETVSNNKKRSDAYISYLGNLKNWEESAKMKDVKLRSLKSTSPPVSDDALVCICSH